MTRGGRPGKHPGRFHIILLIPAILFFAVFVAWPLVIICKTAFMQTNYITEKYIGLANFTDTLRDPKFRRAIFNSIFYIAVLVPIQTAGPVLISLLAYDLRQRWQNSARIAFYLPVLTAGVITSQIWKWVFHPKGPLNWILGKQVGWFSTAATGIPAISMVIFFSTIGATMIMIMAQMQSIDKSLIEAAVIDGATRGQINRRLILPMTAPTIGLVALMAMIGSLQIIETIMLLAPYPITATLTFHIYQEGLVYSRYGKAAAQSILLLFLTVGLTVLKNKISQWAEK
jgi:multiple sugar transport system permease protein